MNEDNQELYTALMGQVEATLGFRLTTPKAYERASERICERTGIRLSRTTLMRMWGYINEPKQPRLITLNTLATFCGYADWHTFTVQYTHHGDQQSNPLLEEKIDVLEDLHAGDHVRFTWKPDRVMEALYYGQGRFEVVYSECTRLRKGTTFSCYLAIKREPLFVSRVEIGDTQISAYVCGKVNGVQFEVYPLKPR